MEEAGFAQTVQVSLKEAGSLMTQPSKGGTGFGQTKEGRMLSEDAGRKGASDTIQQVEKQIAAKQRKNGSTTLCANKMFLLSVLLTSPSKR